MKGFVDSSTLMLYLSKWVESGDLSEHRKLITDYILRLPIH